MNTWVIGNIPIGHQVITYSQGVRDEKGTQELGVKRFFMKARIMAGQANLQNNKFGLEDFKWLAKEEIQKELDARDWKAVKNILAER
jgi:large subunit ribosomal protein L46